MDSQQMIIHRGMKMPKQVLSVEFNIPPDFTGRVVIHIKKRSGYWPTTAFR